jgi:hypothetical protein
MSGDNGSRDKARVGLSRLQLNRRAGTLGAAAVDMARVLEINVDDQGKASGVTYLKGSRICPRR